MKNGSFLISFNARSKSFLSQRLTEKFFKIFNIPICKLVIQIDDGRVILTIANPRLKRK